MLAAINNLWYFGEMLKNKKNKLKKIKFDLSIQNEGVIYLILTAYVMWAMYGFYSLRL
jgi:hypothetical protein